LSLQFLSVIPSNAMITPLKDEFLRLVRLGTTMPLVEEVSASCISPSSALRALRGGGRPVLLESARVNERTGRYSFVAADPYLIFRSRGDSVELSLPSRPAGKYGSRAASSRRPFDKLRDLLGNYRTARVPGLPPFTGGAVGFFSYDFARQFETLPDKAKDDLGLPDAYFVFVDTVVAFDHLQGRSWVIVNPGAREQELGFRRPDPGQWDGFYDAAAERLSATAALLRAVGRDAVGPPVRDECAAKRVTATSGLSRPDFEAMVVRCKEYIAAGDIYQANLSQRFSAPLAGADPFRLYEILRGINPSPFAAYLDFGDVQLAGSSPERLIRLCNGVADTRPIAGTRKKPGDLSELIKLPERLLADEKERAEHIMLLDLERNDLGKVCSYGSVRVDELMAVEDYSHVIHIVSNVRGELAAGKDALELVRAVFPGGTITGAPKVRCMEIIDELEPVARGPYTGSLGYIANTGDMDLNIIIRTFVIKDGVAYVQTGAGIVADSDPAREYSETLHKAEALNKALSML
jgi:aminodeoxychorismate synthase component I